MRTLILNSPFFWVCSLASVNTRRPDAEQCRKHPYFWEPSRRLEFLRLISDRLENLREADPFEIRERLEREAIDIVGEDWSIKLDKDFVERAEKKRKWKFQKNLVRDLLRLVRNMVRVQPQFMSPSLVSFIPLCRALDLMPHSYSV